MRRPGRAAAATTLAVALTLTAAACSGDGEDEEPPMPTGVTQLVPRDFPAGYVDVGIGMSETTDNGTITSTSIIIRPLDLSADPVAEICMEEPDRGLCPVGDHQITRTVEGRLVKIALSDPRAADADTVAYWTDVPLVPLQQ